MRDHRPQSIDTLLGDSQLHNVQQRATALLQLNQAVRALLPRELQSHCRVANFRQGILILEIANASFALRLRYQTPALISALRQNTLPTLVTIEHRINPALAVSATSVRETAQSHYQTDKKRTISPQTAEHLRVLASHSPKALREKLEKLAALAGEETSADQE